MAIERGMNCSATLLASLRPRTAEMLAFVGPHVAAGDLIYREDIREGLEVIPAAFAEMLSGGNFGKMLVRVSPDPTL